jgi:response regulator of citrate/malate metabolism
MKKYKYKSVWPETIKRIFNLLETDTSLTTIAQLEGILNISRQRIHQMLKRAGLIEEAKLLTQANKDRRITEMVNFSKVYNATVRDVAAQYGISNSTVRRYFNTMNYTPPTEWDKE